MQSRADSQTSDKATQEKLQSRDLTLDQALDAFTGTTHSALRAKGKTPLVWQEMVSFPHQG